MALKIQSTMEPEGDFPAVEAKDVLMPDGKRLSEENFAPEQPTEVDITDFNESGIITETFEDGSENTYTFVYDEETDSTTITDSEGNQTVIKGMYNGGESTKFVSPTVEVSKIEGGHRVSVTDKDGTESFDVMDGADGINGTNGTNGADGADGVSPTVAVTEIDGGHRVTITDAEGTKTFDVLDGTGSTAEILSGDTASVTPSEVATAVQEGKPVLISHIDTTYGTLHFTDFSVAENYNLVAASSVFEMFSCIFTVALAGNIADGTWSFTLKEIATADDIVAELPEVTEDDDGKILQVVNGAWAAAEQEEKTVIMEEKTVEGFADINGDGSIFLVNSEGLHFTVTAGETYTVVWDGKEYVTTAKTETAGDITLTVLGNPSIAGLENNTGEPFLMQSVPAGIMAEIDMTIYGTTDAGTSHTVAIYQGDTVATQSWVKEYINSTGKTVTALDLSGYDSGTIVETYSDSTTLTYNLTFDSDGNITKIVDSNGNETVLTW